MRYKVTPRTHDIVGELNQLAVQVLPHLGVASSAARAEWDAVRALWPSDDDLRQGTMALSDVDLEWIAAKVRRFGEILRGLRFNRYASGPGHAA